MTALLRYSYTLTVYLDNAQASRLGSDRIYAPVLTQDLVVCALRAQKITCRYMQEIPPVS